MDKRDLELQIRAVVVTYRREQRRQDARTTQSFLARATSILDGIAPEVQAYPDLAARLREARQEFADAARSPSPAEQDSPVPHTSGK